MEEDLGGSIIAMKAKDQRENLSPSRGEAMEEEAQGGNLSSSLSVAPECHQEGNHRHGDRLHQHTIIITILISFMQSTLPHPDVIPT